MAKHLYVVVDCKTEGCKKVCAVKYHGVDVGQVEIGELAPTGSEYQCGLCGQTHRYEMTEKRMEVFDFPPPTGWINGWEP
jgi:hypothetical protein